MKETEKHDPTAAAENPDIGKDQAAAPAKGPEADTKDSAAADSADSIHTDRSKKDNDADNFDDDVVVEEDDSAEAAPVQAEAPPETTSDPNVQPTEAAASDGKGDPIITIKGITKSFKDHDVLRGVDIHVYKGENLVILGKSGSGKSVLIKCLVGLETPDAGEINILGQDISKLNYDELNSLRIRIGFLFQNAALYDSMSVKENLLFPLRQHKKEMTSDKKKELVTEMLENVGLADSIDQMPSKLSGGQSKRIGLARTLILRPEIMLYDEPTTGLDTGTSREISELICKMKEKYKISSITITHDMPCAKMTADRIIMMKEGAVYAEGTYEELEKSEDDWIKSFFY